MQAVGGEDTVDEEQTIVNIQMKSLSMEKDMECMKEKVETLQRTIEHQNQLIMNLQNLVSGFLLKQNQPKTTILLQHGDTISCTFKGKASSDHDANWNIHKISILGSPDYSYGPLHEDINTCNVTLTLKSRMFVKGIVTLGSPQHNWFIKSCDVSCSNDGKNFVKMGRFKMNTIHNERSYVYFEKPDFYRIIRIVPITYEGWPFFKVGIIVREK